MAPPKGSRRVHSTLSQVSTISSPTVAARSAKSKPTKIVKLNLPQDFLSGLAGQDPTSKATPSKSSTPNVPKPSSTSSAASSSKNKSGSDSAGTSKVEDGDNAQSPPEKPTSQAEDKPVKAGVKREADTVIPTEDGKPKAKAPQRKRPKVGENGRLDGRTSAAKAAGFIASAHKLGPKANQGAINEKLRALDRTSKPCRKWTKTGFKIKSFTGRVWEIPSWNSPQVRSFGSEGGSQGTSNDMSKEENSSNIGSDNSPAVAPIDNTSSPAAAAVVA